MQISAHKIYMNKYNVAKIVSKRVHVGHAIAKTELTCLLGFMHVLEQYTDENLST